MTTPAPDPRSRRTRLLPVLALAVAVLAAGTLLALDRRTDRTANGSVPVGSVQDLAGSWTAVNDAGAPAGLVADVRLVVAGDRLTLATGCTTGRATVAVEDSRLVLDGSGLAVAGTGCDDARAGQEDWVLDMLGARPRLERSGPSLALLWGEGEGSWLGFARDGAGEHG
ncbi:META domain-containing protein [Phycicoccus flavus]|uniref:META domain-containing protein n=1 Tax=Phycicoccus flavus TaxID=2502783 RepID=A0A8T6R2J9_9MICO|nr:META domain-containing protein [Phycicoccus flavus]NHA68588.1 META domain-containing protein [Phycicoccus flavus]